MRRITFLLAVWLFVAVDLQSQVSFPYDLVFNSRQIAGLPGLHSFSVGQHNGEWFIAGGRTDGLHARQPFAAFPASHNNTDIFVINPASSQVHSFNVQSLPVAYREQLQSTNQCFYQDADTLYIIGGYSYAASVNQWITFPSAISIVLPEAIAAIKNGVSPIAAMKRIENDIFAVTGGYIGKIGHKLYLVGGHRFDGRYNPLGGPSYTQQYTEQIRIFRFRNNGLSLEFEDFATISDQLHLHRRDFNLIPQIFPNGNEGLTISAGVFQHNVDLPFLYPVDIDHTGYYPQTTFNQYLSHYHSAKVGLYDSLNSVNHTLFFGGMSQYYYENGQLLQDNLVPFVSTISRLSRDAANTLHEFVMPYNMLGFRGSSAEFVINKALPHHPSLKLIKLNDIQADTFLIGNIIGGIYSPSKNPFANNQTQTTAADANIVDVYLVRSNIVSQQEIHHQSPFEINILNNPVNNKAVFTITGEGLKSLYYFLTSTDGKLLHRGSIPVTNGSDTYAVDLPVSIVPQLVFLTLSINDRYFVSKKLVHIK